MRILLDECIDWRLLRDIAGHELKTARQMGWGAIKNGELLSLASEAFDVFVTVDRNLLYQQNVGLASIMVVVLQARTSRLTDLRPLVLRLLTALETAKPGVTIIQEEKL